MKDHTKYVKLENGSTAILLNIMDKVEDRSFWEYRLSTEHKGETHCSWFQNSKIKER